MPVGHIDQTARTTGPWTPAPLRPDADVVTAKAAQRATPATWDSQLRKTALDNLYTVRQLGHCPAQLGQFTRDSAVVRSCSVSAHECALTLARNDDASSLQFPERTLDGACRHAEMAHEVLMSRQLLARRQLASVDASPQRFSHCKYGGRRSSGSRFCISIMVHKVCMDYMLTKLSSEFTYSRSFLAIRHESPAGAGTPAGHTSQPLEKRCRTRLAGCSG